MRKPNNYMRIVEDIEQSNSLIVAVSECCLHTAKDWLALRGDTITVGLPSTPKHLNFLLTPSTPLNTIIPTPKHFAPRTHMIPHDSFPLEKRDDRLLIVGFSPSNQNG